MKNLDFQQFEILRELLDTYTNDPDIISVRMAASNWVLERLNRGLDQKLADKYGITEERVFAFLEGLEPEYSEFEETVLGKLELSREQRRRFSASLRSVGEGNNKGRDSRKIAWKTVKEYLQDKEQIAFRKQAGIAPARWKSFIEGSNYTGSENLSRISAGLQLNDAEKVEFLSLVIKDNFIINDKKFKEDLRTLIKEQDFSISEFLDHCFISLKAWEPFREKSKDRLSSQATLLKIVIGLSMDYEQGCGFLSRVESGFVVRRDMVVRACLACGIYDVYELYNILELFAEGYGGERLYQNLYRFCD